MKIKYFKTMDISTIHITLDDSRILEQHDNLGHPVIINYGYGYIVHVPKDEELPIKEYQKKKLSAAFINIMKIAKEKKMDYVNIDRDGEEYDKLIKYNW